MDNSEFDRRHFNKLAAAAFGGIVAGTALTGEASAQTDKDSPLFVDAHVCRGLNTCKGKGKSKKNECAGQGTCAIAKAHSCHYKNECKGQGGCGANPGENSCKAKGECAVPLNDKTWKKVRARYEELMKKAGKKFGDAPKKA